MITLELVRKWFSPLATEGELFLDGRHECWTLEDRARHLRSDMMLERLKLRKVYGTTAIPTGVYEVVLYNSPKHGPDTLLLLQVPAFDFSEIHSANRAEELLGCIAVGKDRTLTDDDWIGSSKVALDELKTKIVQRMKDGEKCFITIMEEGDYA